jgi:hypothetical protein
MASNKTQIAPKKGQLFPRCDHNFPVQQPAVNPNIYSPVDRSTWQKADISGYERAGEGGAETSKDPINLHGLPSAI